MLNIVAPDCGAVKEPDYACPCGTACKMGSDGGEGTCQTDNTCAVNIVAPDCGEKDVQQGTTVDPKLRCLRVRTQSLPTSPCIGQHHSEILRADSALGMG